MGLNDVQFKMVIDAVVWGIKHPLRAVADVALKTMQDLLVNVTTSGMGPQFFQKFYIELLQHMFAVATDTTHYAGSMCIYVTDCAILMPAGLNSISSILATLFYTAEYGLSVPLTPGQTVPNDVSSPSMQELSH